eukprot:6185279-Pleurochrysis_carterae.AAC.3
MLQVQPASMLHLHWNELGQLGPAWALGYGEALKSLSYPSCRLARGSASGTDHRMLTTHPSAGTKSKHLRTPWRWLLSQDVMLSYCCTSSGQLHALTSVPKRTQTRDIRIRGCVRYQLEDFTIYAFRVPRQLRTAVCIAELMKVNATLLDCIRLYDAGCDPSSFSAMHSGKQTVLVR